MSTSIFNLNGSGQAPVVLQQSNDTFIQSMVDILIIIVALYLIYHMCIKYFKTSERFSDGRFEDYIIAIKENRFTDELWGEFSTVSMYNMYYQLDRLGKAKSMTKEDWSKTVTDYYGTKENFMIEMLKIYE